MKVIANANCTGKTKELIKQSLETGAPILALTPLKASSLREKAKAYFDCDHLKILDFDEAQRYDGPIPLDDADEIISELVRLAFNNINLKVSGMVVNI